MARAIWTGSISFGLVNVPVKLYSATEDKEVHFHEMEEGTGARIRHQRVSADSGEEVPYDKIVKGYELSKGKYVIVSPDELDSVAPGRSRTIDIEDFVDLEDIDPIYFRTTYYLAPADEPATKTFALLRSALEDAGRVGIARFVMRSKQYLAALRPTSDTLVLETMYFADEIRDAKAIEGVEAASRTAGVTERERAAARQLVDSLTSEWDPERYRDTYRERVLDLIEAKAKGKDVVVEEEEPQAEVVDLMAALQASVEAARQGRRPNASRSKDSTSKASTSKGSTSKGSTPARSGRHGKDYAAMSKDELLEQAKEGDVAGRSKMTRDELVDALERAS
ncbi:MAG: Ku protein [Actinobacteria bacterium]|nr:Ku protein [Actinomycetota bacterium]